jgi:hypothetical protein
MRPGKLQSSSGGGVPSDDLPFEKHLGAHVRTWPEPAKNVPSDDRPSDNPLRRARLGCACVRVRTCTHLRTYRPTLTRIGPTSHSKSCNRSSSSVWQTRAAPNDHIMLVHSAGTPPNALAWPRGRVRTYVPLALPNVPTATTWQNVQ